MNKRSNVQSKANNSPFIVHHLSLFAFAFGIICNAKTFCFATITISFVVTAANGLINFGTRPTIICRFLTILLTRRSPNEDTQND